MVMPARLLRATSGCYTLLHSACPSANHVQVLEDVGDEAAVYSPLARGASILSDRGYLEGSNLGSPHSSCSPSKALPQGDGACTPRSAANSPTRQPRGVRNVQFGSSPPAATQWWGGEEEAVAVQRVGRRPSFTQQQLAAAARQLAASPPAAPGSRRVLREAESIAAKAGRWDEALRDLDTGEAALVRPTVRRLPRG